MECHGVERRHGLGMRHVVRRVPFLESRESDAAPDEMQLVVGPPLTTAAVARGQRNDFISQPVAPAVAAQNRYGMNEVLVDVLRVLGVRAAKGIPAVAGPKLVVALVEERGERV